MSVESLDKGKAAAAGGTLTTLTRGLAILEYIATADKLVRLRDVAAHFDMDRSSALRFLRTLEAEGYLARHVAMKVYSLGPKLLSFPRLPDQSARLIELAKPILQHLVKETGQVAHLATLNGVKAVLIEVVASDAAVSVKQAIGDLEPLYSSAVGKAIYANLPEEERRALAGQIVFQKLTDRTIGDAAKLEEEARQVRESGISFDRQEGNTHVSCVGCPIFSPSGTPIASIGLSYVTALLSGPIDAMTRDIELLRKAARTIEEALASAGGLRVPALGG